MQTGKTTELSRRERFVIAPISFLLNSALVLFTSGLLFGSIFLSWAKTLYVFICFWCECFHLILLCVCREELEKQRAHERYMRLQEQGKTEQARKDLGKLIKYHYNSCLHTRVTYTYQIDKNGLSCRI